MTGLKTNWVTGEEFAASDVNTIATAVNANTSAIATSVNSSLIRAATVATGESTSSTTYTDLTTTTDQVTVTIQSSGVALVYIAASNTYVGGTGGNPLVSFEISGATTRAASDAFVAGTTIIQMAPSASALHVVTGLTPGLTTFKMKYRVSAAVTFSFSNRRIVVVPL